MKTNHNIFLSILAFLFISCNSDDEPEEVIDKHPSPFELIVENITVDSATIKWEESISSNNSTVKYSIYLNDSLIQIDQNGNEFSLLDLGSATNFEVKVVAKDEFGEQSSSLEFSTLESLTFYINKIIDDSSVYEFRYNSLKKIKEIERIAENQKFGDMATLHSFAYNENGRLLNESYWRSEWINQDTEYIYSNDTISEIKIRWNIDGEVTHNNRIYQDNLSYTRNQYYNSFYDGELFSRNWEVTMVFDDLDRVISHKVIDLEKSKTNTYSFEYDNNNNLIKFINNNGVHEDVHEIVYDDKKNFHTYISGYGGEIDVNDIEMDLAGLWDFGSHLLKEVPPLFDHVNSNNPLHYKFNGEIYTSFEYEYNEYNYPIKMTIESKSGIIALLNDRITEYQLEYIQN